LFLNRTGFNGLYRVNSHNQFDVPYGRHKKVFIPDRELLQKVSEYFNSNAIEFRTSDFRTVISEAKSGDFIYVDPPYAPLDLATSSFTGYTSNGFDIDDLKDLKFELDSASERGAHWLMSNALTSVTASLFPSADYSVLQVDVKRPINARGSGRGSVTEILVAPK